MHQTGGSGWRITTDTSGPHDDCTVCSRCRRTRQRGPSGALPHAAPKIRPADHAHLTADVGGISALKTEWEAWWEQLLKAHPQMSPGAGPPRVSRLSATRRPCSRVLQAHFGSALTWARERRSEYAELEAERVASGASQLLATWWMTG